MNRHKISDSAVFLTKYLSQLPSLPDQAIVDIVQWAAGHHSNEDALWHLSRLTNKLRDASDAAKAEYVNAAVACLEFHLPTVSASLRLTFAIIWGALGTNFQFANDPIRASLVGANVFKSGKVFEGELGFSMPYGCEAFLIKLLEQGALDPGRDTANISRFVSVMKGSHQKPERLDWLLRRLNARYPEYDWQ